jgi:hypothetical protein
MLQRSGRSLLNLNPPPRKQDPLYRLSLDRSLGPYPSKDIVPNNSRSIQRLPQAEVDQHMSVIRSLEEAESRWKTAQLERQPGTPGHQLVVRLNSVSDQLRVLEKNFQRVKTTFNAVKRELLDLQMQINTLNESEAGAFKGCFRHFQQGLRFARHSTCNEFYVFDKEIKLLEHGRKGLIQQMLAYQKRILSLETELGVTLEPELVKEE